MEKNSIFEKKILYSVPEISYLGRVLRFSFINIGIVLFFTCAGIFGGVKDGFPYLIAIVIAICYLLFSLFHAKNRAIYQLLRVAFDGNYFIFDYLDKDEKKNVVILANNLVISGKHVNGKTGMMKLILEEKKKNKFVFFEKSTIFVQHEFGELSKKIEQLKTTVVIN